MLYFKKKTRRKTIKKSSNSIIIMVNRFLSGARNSLPQWCRFKNAHRLSGKITVLLCLIGLLLYSSLNSLVWASLTQISKSVTSAQDFSKGTLVNTVVTSSEGGEVKLNGDGGPGWFDPNWQKRKPVTIINSGSAQTNYQIKLTVSYDSDMQSDFDDLRFANSSGTQLDYWLQSKTDSVEAVVWVEVDSLAGSGNTTIYMYYRNASVTSGSNGDNTFAFFDTFDNFNSSKWSATGNYSVSSSQITITTGSVYSKNTVASQPNYISEAKIKWNNFGDYSGLEIANAQSTQGSNSGKNKLVYLMTNSSSSASVTAWAADGTTASYNIASGATQFTATAGTSYIIGHAVTSSNVRFYRDRTQTNAYNGTWSAANYLWLGYFTGASAGGANIADIAVDWVLIRKFASSEPTSSFGTEESALAPSGTYASPYSTAAGSGIINLVWNGGWSNNGNGHAFEATVDVPSNSSINLKMRSSLTGGSSDSDWSSWVDLGTAMASGVFGVSASELSGVPEGENRYIQIKATLTSSDGIANPALKDLTVWYLADQENPSNPTSCNGYEDSSKTTALNQSNWYNYSAPYFEFGGATDSDSGIAGYFVYFGTDGTAIPQTAGTFQVGTNYTADIDPSDSEKTFYLRIQSQDKAGNVYTAPDISNYNLFAYKYDATLPANPAYASANPAGYSSVDYFSLSWPAGADSCSGVKGYEYKRADDPSWNFTASRSITGVTSYQNGENFFYVRTVDNAGNRGASQAQAPYYFNANAPSAPQNVQVNPSSNTTNSFSFSWEEPEEHTGTIVGYYYSVNVSPTQETATYVSGDSIPAYAAATRIGMNIFYVVAKDDSGNVGWGNPGSVAFWSNTQAPGIPVSISVTDSSNRDISDWRLTVNWQAPTFTGDDFAGYRVFRSTNGSDFELIATTTSAGYLDSGLSNGNTYYYKVSAYDSTNNEGGLSSIAARQPTGRYTSAPKLIGGPSVSVSSTKASITWTTDRECDSFVEYGETASYGYTQGQIGNVKEHMVKLTGLRSSTNYYFRARWRDSDGNVGYSSAGSFMTDESSSISNVKMNDISLYSATAQWKTTTVATSKVLYGKTTAYGQEVEDKSGSSVTNHTLKLEGLSHSSVYHFKIELIDTDGNVKESDDYTFETLKYPSISNIVLQPVKGELAAAITVNWESNVPTTSIVEYAPSANKDNVKEESKSKLETKHAVTITDLQDNAEYVLTVKGRDQFGNMAESDVQTFKTDYDTRPPKISNVATETSVIGAGDEARGQVIVSWDTDEAATSQVEYGIGVSGTTYSNKTQEDAGYITSHVVVISNLRPSTCYHFRMISQDKVKNVAKSADNSVLTGQARRPVLDLVIESLRMRLGWLFKSFRI